MKRILNAILTLIVLVIGALIVFASPADPIAITFGMFLISVAILILAVQIYFPPTKEEPVELKVVEPAIEEIKKAPERIVNPRKVVRKKKKR